MNVEKQIDEVMDMVGHAVHSGINAAWCKDTAARNMDDASKEHSGDIAAVRAKLRAILSSRCLHQLEEPSSGHPDDIAVDALAALMKAKLAKQRAKGYGGWNDKAQCNQQHLSSLLRNHVDKGDPVDVANFCAMLSARGEGIAAAPQAVLSSSQSGELMPCSPFGPSCNCETCNPAPALNVAHAVQAAVPTPFTSSIMLDDGGDRPYYCLMTAYLSEAEARAALSLLSAPAQPAPTAEPSDAEIDAAIQAFDWEGWIDPQKAKRAFTREALARWTAPAHPAEGVPAQAVGEVVLFGDDCKEISWAKGQLPAVGTKLYAHPPQQVLAATQPAAQGLDAKNCIPWVPVQERMPVWTEDESVRVLALTTNAEFCGEQVHDIKASDFYLDDGDGVIGTEITEVCTHWVYRDDVWPRVAAQAKQGG